MSESKRPITAEDLNRIITIESPRISPDGRHAAFVKVTPDPLERGYKRNIWLHDMKTGANAQLTRGDKDSQPAWSPDGKSLAFVSARGDKAQIYLLPLHGVGGEARQLTAMANGAHSPAWSPDSVGIAFLAPSREDEREAEDRGETLPQPRDKLEGKHQKERRAEDEKARWDPRPMWRIPYRQGVSFLDERYDQVHVINVAEGSKPRRLTNINADYSPPQFSADGSEIFSARAAMPDADEPWRGAECLSHRCRQRTRNRADRRRGEPLRTPAIAGREVDRLWHAAHRRHRHAHAPDYYVAGWRGSARCQRGAGPRGLELALVARGQAGVHSRKRRHDDALVLSPGKRLQRAAACRALRH